MLISNHHLDQVIRLNIGLMRENMITAPSAFAARMFGDFFRGQQSGLTQNSSSGQDSISLALLMHDAQANDVEVLGCLVKNLFKSFVRPRSQFWNIYHLTRSR
jgi:hypothetical protein